MTTSADEPVTEHDDSSGTGAGGVGVGDVIEAEVDEFDEPEDAVDEDAAADAHAENVDADLADDESEMVTDAGAVEEDPAPMNARIPPARSASGTRGSDDLFGAAEPEPVDDEPELAESDSTPGRFVPNRRGRGGYDPEADAVARAARYRFRQRTTLALALSALLFGAFALVLAPLLWWGCALSVLGLAGYLFYLRRQVRFEEEIRRRRSSRLSRAERPAADRDQLRSTGSDAGREEAREMRRRAVVMDIDDEDPMFDFLETFDAAAARATRNRVAGSEIPRAAGE